MSDKDSEDQSDVEQNEESSDSLDNDGGVDDDEEAEDLINANFRKVQRTKTKFRCQLEDVMIHINGKDYIVKNMTADIAY